MRRIGYRRTADVTGERVSRRHARRSLHKTARGTPPRTAYVARIPVPSICVTSGPGVPTGGSLSHAQRQASTFLRRRTLRHTARQQRSNAISGVSIPNVPARFPGDFWPAKDFFTTETRRHRESKGKGRLFPLLSVPLRLCGELPFRCEETPQCSRNARCAVGRESASASAIVNAAVYRAGTRGLGAGATTDGGNGFDMLPAGPTATDGAAATAAVDSWKSSQPFTASENS